ncbi:unnamed protein product [Tuber aestivum]|uniref:Uncharacterized protein n=1 Tax=Tuber aestivum TaxID=59557 RepID=A0A292PSR2_9PEZI|nr:unnamed protein product [Tuber aestivum]
MEKRFESWKEFVLNLRLAVTDSETEKANLMKQNEEQRAAREAGIAQRKRAEEEARKAVSVLQDAFRDARESLQTAMSGVNRATESFGKPPDPESIPKFELKKPDKHRVEGGVVGQVFDFLTGGTRAARQAEREYNEAQLRAGEIRKDFLKDHYEAARKRVEEARKNAAETQRIHMAIVEKQRAVEEDLQRASEAIIESTLDLGNLDTEKLTLAQIQDILKDSLKALTYLKSQVTRIVDFYSGITLMVKDASEHACDDFIETINLGLEDGGDETKTIERMELHEMQKRDVQTTALRVQSYFSVIQEVSSIYVQVSKRHILPGISMIDELGLQDGPDPGESARKRQTLDDYAYNTKKEVRMVATAKQEEIKSGLWRRVRQFATQAKLLPPPTPEELALEEEEAETFYPAE